MRCEKAGILPQGAGRVEDVIRNYIRRQEALNRRVGQLGGLSQESPDSAIWEGLPN